MCYRRKEVDVAIEFFYILIILAYVCATGIIFMGFMNSNFTYFSYKANYKRWTSLNWFGVGFITSVIHILALPFSIGYDICRLIRWIFTVGMKN
jgi:hypothetical protein